MSDTLTVRVMQLNMFNIGSSTKLAESHRAASNENTDCVAYSGSFVGNVSSLMMAHSSMQSLSSEYDVVPVQQTQDVMESSVALILSAIILAGMRQITPKTVYDTIEHIAHSSSGSRYNWSFLDLPDFPPDVTWQSYNAGNPSMAETITREYKILRVTILSLLRGEVRLSRKVPNVTILRPYLFFRCKRVVGIYMNNFGIDSTPTMHEVFLHEQNKNQAVVANKYDKGYYVERKGVT